MVQPVRLKLNGKPFEKNPLTPLQLKLKTFLEKAPKDDIYSVDALSRATGISISRLNKMEFKGALDLSQHTYHIGSRIYYGSAAAIAELRRQTA